jgi:hypothetical protein
MSKYLSCRSFVTYFLVSFHSIAYSTTNISLADQDELSLSNGAIARGTVFLDKNNNGVRDKREPGIKGVSVSNGTEVVRTDKKGDYEIYLPEDSILFISKPSKYDVPVNENNLPQFYYLHYPNGTPDIAEWNYDVIDATGPLPSSIDFPLIRSKTNLKAHRKGKFRAMAFADPQAKTEEDQDEVREDIINELIDNPHDALFGVTAGDVVYDTLSLYDRHNRMFGLIGIPMWNVPGNHDINFPSPDNTYAYQTYSKHFGPTYYSFEYGDMHLIALNNIEYAGFGNEFDLTKYRGYITDEQLEWIANDLSYVDKDKLIVLVSHIPLVTNALDGRGERYNLGSNINTTNLDMLLQILEPFSNIYAIAGHDTSNSWKVEINHTHGWYATPWIAHTLAEVRGNGWNKGPPNSETAVRAATMQDGNPNGYYVLHFDETNITPQFIPAGQKSNLNDKMRVVLDPWLEGTTDPSGEIIAINRGTLAPGTKVVVNLYDGGERDTVLLSLDNGDFIEMQHVLRTDPFMERQFAKYTGTPDAFSTPQPSSHMWEYELPHDLKPGLHKIVINSIDEFDQYGEQAFSFELLEQ